MLARGVRSRRALDEWVSRVDLGRSIGGATMHLHRALTHPCWEMVRMYSMRKYWRSALGCAAILAVPATLAAQGATITGHVTSSTGTPLPAVTVSIAGMGLGTITREDGLYSFTVP